MSGAIFLFGEAEKGAFCTPLLCTSLPQLMDTVGNPPEDSEGIVYAIQTLLYEKKLIFFRVKEEGFSTVDYMKGFKLLQKKQLSLPLTAICMPGVGDATIIEAANPICALYRSPLIITERDLYDYFTYTQTK